MILLILGACVLQVEEDRRPQVEAAIVRVLKARRLLDHNSIVAQARLTPERPRARVGVQPASSS